MSAGRCNSHRPRVHGCGWLGLREKLNLDWDSPHRELVLVGRIGVVPVAKRVMVQDVHWASFTVPRSWLIVCVKDHRVIQIVAAWAAGRRKIGRLILMGAHPIRPEPVDVQWCIQNTGSFGEAIASMVPPTHRCTRL